MSKSNKKCVFCGAYLFPEDDVVYCPECGAPHHRECYLKLGECALKQKHGTDEEYKNPPAEEIEEEVKPQTDALDTESEDLGGIPFAKINVNVPDFNGEFKLEDTINGVTIKKLMTFIFVNPLRYIRKFLEIQKGQKVSWNWLAFLFPAPWLFLRKQYKSGVLALILCIASLVLALPFSAQVGEIARNAENYYDLAYKTLLSLDASSVPMVLCAFFGSLLDIGIRVVCGLFGDKLYYLHVFEKLDKLSKDEDFEESSMTLRKAGGVNLWAALACMIILEYTPVLIGYFIL